MGFQLPDFEGLAAELRRSIEMALDFMDSKIALFFSKTPPRLNARGPGATANDLYLFLGEKRYPKNAFPAI
jgi:hypothetical protein